jgi:hypothetical protein
MVQMLLMSNTQNVKKTARLATCDAWLATGESVEDPGPLGHVVRHHGSGNIAVGHGDCSSVRTR